MFQRCTDDKNLSLLHLAVKESNFESLRMMQQELPFFKSVIDTKQDEVSSSEVNSQLILAVY